MVCTLINGDCLEEMQKLIDEGVKVDLILTDPPYNITANKWDSIIPLDEMWGLIKQIIKPYGIIILFSTQPFTSIIISSMLEWYRYSWIWNKDGASNFLNVNYMPLKVTEDINIFSQATVGSLSKHPIFYNPQNVKEIFKKKQNKPESTYRKNMGYNGEGNILNSNKSYIQEYENYPFKRDKNKFHPTQKPVELLEYLIKTYSNENDTVLDFTMGSGSTGVACLQTNRNFIGIELDTEYFKIAKERCKNYQSKLI